MYLKFYYGEFTREKGDILIPSGRVLLLSEKQSVFPSPAAVVAIILAESRPLIVAHLIHRAPESRIVYQRCPRNSPRFFVLYFSITYRAETSTCVRHYIPERAYILCRGKFFKSALLLQIFEENAQIIKVIS